MRDSRMREASVREPRQAGGQHNKRPGGGWWNGTGRVFLGGGHGASLGWQIIGDTSCSSIVHSLGSGC